MARRHRPSGTRPCGSVRDVMQHVIDPIVTFCTNLIGHWGLPAVFVLMLLESACIPIPSEATMPFAGFAVSQGHLEPDRASSWRAWPATSSVRSIAYAVGYYGGRPFVERYGRYVLLRPHHLDLAERFFARYGPITVFVGARRAHRAHLHLAARRLRPHAVLEVHRLHRAGLHPLGRYCSATWARSWAATGRRSGRCCTTSTTPSSWPSSLSWSGRRCAAARGRPGAAGDAAGGA